MSKISKIESRKERILYQSSPYFWKYSEAVPLCGMTVPIMEVTARESKRNTVSFTEVKNFHTLLVVSDEFAFIIIIYPLDF